MNFYIKELINGDPNAGSKARNDISEILANNGWAPVTLNFIYDERIDKRRKSRINKIADNIKLRIEWEKQLKRFGKNDKVLIQFPVLRRPVFLSLAISKAKERGAKIILLVHDLELLRYASRSDVSRMKKWRITFEEKSVMSLADKIIVHNSRMKNKMVEMGYDISKLIELEMFDYLVPQYSQKKHHVTETHCVAIAGTLRTHKTKYLQCLPKNVDFELYGVGYEDQGIENVHYHGAFSPDELPMAMDASYGLVWDGDSAETCSGIYGEYLKINNPHKTSLYLVSGIPVIIWKKAALARFVEEKQVGITIDSLHEIAGCLRSISDEQYQLMLENVNAVSKKLRNGYYCMHALSQL